MELYIIFNLITCIFAMIGFVYGVICILRSKRPMYFIMIVASVGITAFCRLYEVVYMWIAGEYFRGFHIGILGTIGTFLFVFTANFGAMDSLADDGSKRLHKYRIIALIAPLIIAMAYVPITMSRATTLVKVCFGMICIMIMMSSYFNLKHLIIPDVDYGIVKCIRAYNLLMLLNGVFHMYELIGIAFNTSVFLYIASACIAVVSLLIVPVLKKGAAKWII